MKNILHASLKLAALLLGLLSAHTAISASVIWSGAGGNQIWSNPANWSGGTPGGNSVFFYDTDATGGSGPFGFANNVVDASTTIVALTYGNTNGFQTTQIPSGSLLTVTGTSGFPVYTGTGTDNGNKAVYATVWGEGRLLVTNTAGTLVVIQGSGSANGALATLDLQGLNTFTAYVSQIRVAAENGIGSSSPYYNRPNGTLILAKTNLISCAGSPGLRMSRTASNGGKAIVMLGQANTILCNAGLEVGGRKSLNSQLMFNPAFSAPTATFRDLAGTGRQAQWTIGDGSEQTTSSGSASSATADFTSGTVDALVNTIIVGRAGGGPGVGTLTFDGGTIDVNTLDLGVATTTFNSGTGTVNVNGTGQLLVNGNLFLGSGAGGGSASHGLLNIGPISGGAVTIQGDVICGGGVGSKITLFGALAVAGKLGDNVNATNTPLETLELWSGTLTFDLGSAGNPVDPLASVTNLNVNGNVTLGVVGQNLSIGQFPLIKYYSGLGDVGGYSGFSGLALSVPSNVEAYLSNNTANASVDLVITGITSTKWAGAVNGDWDINATANWVLTPSGTPKKYQEASLPGDAVVFDDTATGTTNVNLTTTLSPGGILVSNVTKTYTFSGAGRLSGPTGLVKQGAGTLVLSNTGTNDFTAPVGIEAGTVQINGSDDRLPTNGVVTLADESSATLDLNGFNQTLGVLSGGGTAGGNVKLGAGTLTVAGDGGNLAGIISGTGAVVRDGTGTQILSGANLYAGGTHVVSGTLTVANLTGSGTGLGSVSVDTTNATLRLGDGGADGSVAAGAIANEGLVVLNRSDDLAFTQPISGGGAFRKENRNTVTLPIANSYTGATTVATGALRVSNAGALGDATGATSIGNDATAVLELTGDITLLEPIVLNQKQSAAGNVPGLWNVSGTNTLAGPLQLTAGGSFWTVQSAAGRLVVNGTVTNVTTSNTRTLWLSGDGDGEWNGGLPDGVSPALGALRKDGTGTWTLGGINNYSGPTVVSNGTLLVDGTITHSSGVTVAGGALGGAGTISVPVTVNPEGTLVPGDSIGTLHVSNSLTLNGTTVMELAKSGATMTNDQVSVLTTLTLGGTLDVTLTGTTTGGEVFTLFTAGSFSGTFSATNLPALPSGLTWDTSNLGGGVLAIASLTRPTLGLTAAGNVLTFSWSNPGYKLQAQTNTLNAGLGANWADYPDARNPINVTNDPANPAVFFRLAPQ